MKYVVYILLTFMILSCNRVKSKNEIMAERWWTESDRKLILSELDRTTIALETTIRDLSDKQWHFRENASRWSIAEIVEHLEMQNQLHFREITVSSMGQQHPEFREITEGKDSTFIKYSTSPKRSTAKWFLEPRGRYDTLDEGWSAFELARNELRQFVAHTNIDLRKQFTYRSPVHGKNREDLDIGDVRDLHQLLLTGIAHTDRHIQQIRKIKEHPGFK